MIKLCSIEVFSAGHVVSQSFLFFGKETSFINLEDSAILKIFR